MKIKNYSVPVLMFHSVGATHLNWPYHFLSEEVEFFERKIDYLVRTGHRFISHEDLFYYMKDGLLIPEKSIMVTFDDGFLDNWVFVFPILKKRQLKFTVYVSQEFVDPSDLFRPTMEDVWSGRIAKSDLQILGYLSWAEMRAMEKSGLVDIQSHTSTHTWYFNSDEVIDFYNPQNAYHYPWLRWNHFPVKKPRWMLNDSERELWGLPIYNNRRAMVATRYYENPDLNQKVQDVVAENGGATFFSKYNWRNELANVIESYRKKGGQNGRFETESERMARLRHELLGNKRAIEEALDKEVRFLCWPGGAYNDRLIQLAEECGYLASTVKRGQNTYGNDPRFIKRISSGNPAGNHRFPWKYPIFTFRFYLDRFQRKSWALAMDRIYRKTTA